MRRAVKFGKIQRRILLTNFNEVISKLLDHLSKKTNFCYCHNAVSDQSVRLEYYLLPAGYRVHGMTL